MRSLRIGSESVLEGATRIRGRRATDHLVATARSNRLDAEVPKRAAAGMTMEGSWRYCELAENDSEMEGAVSA